jgi:DNA polymerase bacteriophage-type
MGRSVNAFLPIVTPETDIIELSLDYETRSLIALPDTGPYVYAMDPSTDIWCAAWKFDDMDEPEIWTPTTYVSKDGNTYTLENECPPRIVEHILSGGIIRAHNAAFERLITQHIATKRYGWPAVRLEQWVCSAAEAAAMSLPRSLGQLAKVLGVDMQKDDEGHNLMLRMCRPRSFLSDGTPVWWDVPERRARLEQYCKDDVKAEQACSNVMRRLIPAEREIYLLSEEMNDRGMHLDRELILAARDVADVGIEMANAIVSTLTDGAVSGVTKVAAMKAFVIANGVEVASLNKDVVKELLETELPEKVRGVLEQRAVAGRTSLAKLDSMLACVCNDDRVRGTTMYHGAGTGRWTGKLVQPHNFTRGEVDNIEGFIPAVLERDYGAIDLIKPPTVVISSLLRSMITAKPGNMLVAADYSAIEARMLNWLAGQTDITALFAAGKDVYKYNAAKLFNIPLADVQKMPHRQTGKFQELGCGFGMGPDKGVVSANTAQYGYLVITLERMKEIVADYRATHSHVTDYWKECNDAAIESVLHPMQKFAVGPMQNVKFITAGAYLYIVLPSGRALCFPSPKVEPMKTPWGEMRDGVSFWGVNSVTRQWQKQRLYGGLIVENIVQAASRDIMAEGKLRARAAGYAPVMSVHDEVITEVPADFGSAEELERILCELPEWAIGCPIAAEGWKGFRYRK